MNIETTLERIYSMHQFHIKLGLERIEKLLAFLGNPEKDFQSIHIAGSNGKGSTASFISSILTETGLNTGLYTSPHLQKFNERIRFNGITIPDDYIVNFIEELDHFIKEEEPSFFEITTALAFKYFSEMKIDIGVIETGLGGRLDATNTLNPICSIITTISDEHSNILGKNISKIAAEKAGIIKQNGRIFAGMIKGEALDEIISVSKNKNAKLIELSNYISLKNDSVYLKLEDEQFVIYKTPIPGNHQLINAALSILSINKIFPEISNKNILDGIDNVTKNSGLRCRYEYYSHDPVIIFDAAHNVESIQAFSDSFAKEKRKYEKCILIFGAMNDKDVKKMLQIVKDQFDKIYLTASHYERAMPVVELKKIADELKINAEIELNHVELIMKNKLYKNNDCLVVLGSIYLLGEILNGLEIKIS